MPAGLESPSFRVVMDLSGTLPAALKSPPVNCGRRARRLGAAIVALALGATGVGILLLGRWPVLAGVETGKTPEYPYLKAASYAERPDIVFDRACEAVRRIKGFTLEEIDRDEGFIHVRVVARPIPFESAVDIRVSRVLGVTRVDVRSEPKGTAVNLGQDARNIRRFLTELRIVMREAQGGAARPR